MPVISDTPNDLYGDPGDLEGEASGSDDYQEIILQQSVTMLAYMDRTGYNTTEVSELSESSLIFGFHINNVALIIGSAIGAIIMVLIVTIGALVCRYYKYRDTMEKTYCLNNSSSDEANLKLGQSHMHHSDSVVFLGSKASQVSTRTLSLKKDFCKSFMTRSQSVPLKDGIEVPKLLLVSKPFSKRRPLSQPVHLPFVPSAHSSKRGTHPYTYHHLPNADAPPSGLASIPETVLRSSEFLHGTPSLSLYASCNALDGPRTYSSLYSAVNTNTSMKARSLPLWGRSKLRPLSTEDDLNELYAKVNFSKKRKNRMRSDSAAAIAVNKSRTNHSTQFAHKDTDSLVENEAVVVYDERTAL